VCGGPSIVQSPYDEAKNAIRVAVRLAEGQKVEKTNIIETPKVTKDNIAQVSRPTF
jgi:ribose transport system substrate-binding protein